MSTIKPKLDKDHAITLIGDGASGELTLVKGGARNAYIWCGHRDVVTTFSGRKALKAFAAAINKELRK